MSSHSTVPRTRMSRLTRRDDWRCRTEDLDFPTKVTNASISTLTVTLDSTTASFGEASHQYRRGVEAFSDDVHYDDEPVENARQRDMYRELSSHHDTWSRPSLSSRAQDTSDHTSTTNQSLSIRHASRSVKPASKPSTSKAYRDSRSRSSTDLLCSEREWRQSSHTLEDKYETSMSTLSSFGQGPDRSHAFQLDVRRMSMQSAGGEYLTEDDSISSKGGIYNDHPCPPRMTLDRIPSIRRDIPNQDTTQQLRRPSMNVQDSPQPKQPTRRRSFTLLFGVPDSRFQKIEESQDSSPDVSPEFASRQKLQIQVESQNGKHRSKVYGERRSRSLRGLGFESSKPTRSSPINKSSSRNEKNNPGKTTDEKPQRRPSIGDLFMAFKEDLIRGRQSDRDVHDSHHRSHSLGTLHKLENSSGEKTRDRKPRTGSFDPNTSLSRKCLLDHYDREMSFHEQDRLDIKLDALREQKANRSARRSSTNLTSSHSRSNSRSNSRSRLDEDPDTGAKLRKFRDNLVHERKPDQLHRDGRKSSDSHDDISKATTSRSSDSRYSSSSHHRSSYSNHYRSSLDEPKEHRRSKSRQRRSKSRQRLNNDDHRKDRHHTSSHRRSKSRQRLSDEGSKRSKSSSSSPDKSSRHKAKSHRSHSRSQDLVLNVDVLV